MQVFVMCPFCDKVFDSLAEPHAVLRIDSYVRTAHARCINAAVPAGRLPVSSPAGGELAGTDPVKPNGKDKSDARA